MMETSFPSYSMVPCNCHSETVIEPGENYDMPGFDIFVCTKCGENEVYERDAIDFDDDSGDSL